MSDEHADKIRAAAENVCESEVGGPNWRKSQAYDKAIDLADGRYDASLPRLIDLCNAVVFASFAGVSSDCDFMKAAIELNRALLVAGVLKNPYLKNQGETVAKTELSEMQKRDDQAEKDAKFVSVEVVNQGDQIILPKDMSPKRAIEWITRRMEEDEREVAINEPVESYPLDGAHALMVALKQKYGWAEAVPTPSFWGERPPALVGVEIAPGKTTQVVWGRVEIPGLAGYLSTGFAKREGRFIFCIQGKVKQKHKAEVAEIVALTKQIVREKSLYKGKAIKVNLVEEDEDTFDPQENAPRFIDTSKVDESKVILNDDVMAQVIDSVFVPMEMSQRCREFGIPLKRGVLLSGRYGTGKTLVSLITASKCEQNGWTYIYVSKAAHLQQAILFAQQYQPAVVFAEDIDRATEGEERTEDIDAILNTLDGVDTKNSELLVVLTTNHIEKINKAMLRPGRLDAVITLPPPDADSVQKLIRMYGGSLVEGVENLSQVGKMLAGQIPAVIEETVKRAKLAVIGRKADFVGRLTAHDLERAAHGMLAQVRLVTQEAVTTEHPVDRLGRHLGTEFAKATTRFVRELSNGDGHESEVEEVEA